MIFEKIREEIEDAKGWEDIDGKPRFTFRDKQMLEIAIGIINQVEAEGGWIKCEGKTFAVGCKYLIVDKDNDIYIATYLNDNVFIARDKNYFMPIRLEATYCQLLPLPPQPPKGE